MNIPDSPTDSRNFQRRMDPIFRISEKGDNVVRHTKLIVSYDYQSFYFIWLDFLSESISRIFDWMVLISKTEQGSDFLETFGNFRVICSHFRRSSLCGEMIKKTRINLWF